MKTIPNELTKNFGNPKCRRQLMREYGNSQNAYYGSNNNGEAVLISISVNRIQVTTYQDNGWVRIDDYDALGFKESERFEGRWRTSGTDKREHATTKNSDVSAGIQKAVDNINPNYNQRHNDIVFASDICRTVLSGVSLPSAIKEKLASAIKTLDSIARR